MKIQIKKLLLGGRECTVCTPPAYEKSERKYPVIYINGAAPLAEIVEELTKEGICLDFFLVSVESKSWKDDFTPWVTEEIREGEGKPGGFAVQYLNVLVEEIKPGIDALFPTESDREHTSILGYSLGGLAAIYSLFYNRSFGNAASISGSLWYEGFLEYIQHTPPCQEKARVYLSLGKKESKSRNRRMAEVGNATKEAAQIFTQAYGSDNICLQWNNGGHFYEVERRYAHAVAWLRKGGRTDEDRETEQNK